MSKSNRTGAVCKPSKPRLDFPLFPHQNGRWAKKVRGKLCYFGKWAEDPDGEQALKLWINQKDELLAGKPQPEITRNEKGRGLPLHRLINDYLNAKRQTHEAGEITARTFSEYHATGQRLSKFFGRERSVESLTASDFGRLRSEISKSCGPVRLGNEITRTKMIFRFAYDEGLIDQPIRYGQSFNKPGAKVLRLTRAHNGSRMFETDELRLVLDLVSGKPVAVEGSDEPLIETANPLMQAIVLTAINCGYGQTDIARLPLSALDFADDWATFPRPKTGIERRAKMWPETVEAIREYMEIRPEAKCQEDSGLVFLMASGKRLLRYSQDEDPTKWGSRTDVIGRWFTKRLKRLGIKGRRGFYAIRHSFQTAAEESRDLPAVMHAMGHSDNSMSARYRERITDERLEAVADAVHMWLFGAEGSEA